jgi:ATP-dependent RNA helicase RhlE
MLFSATISNDVDRLAQRALNDPAAVEVARRATPANGIEHGIVAVDKLNKKDALARLLQLDVVHRALIFTRTKYGADKLARHLKKEGLKVGALHGDKAQSARQRTLEDFREGHVRILVATDVAARGIDVDAIDMVVNYDVPADPEIYVHRVGRTARAGAQGLALTLMAPDEWFLVAAIEKLIGQTFPREILPGFEPSVAPPPAMTLVRERRPSTPGIKARRGMGRRR